MIRFLSILILALSPFELYSQAQDRTPVALEQQALQALVADLKERTITLTQPFYVYHWTTKKKLKDPGAVGLQNAVEERLTTIAKDTLASFDQNWKRGRPWGLVGGGIYAARDPISSNSYGFYDDFDDAVMVSIRLDPGAKLFDLRAILDSKNSNDPDVTDEFRYGNNIYIRNETANLLLQIGCEVSPLANIRNSWLSNHACSRILGMAFQNLQIIGNVHSWWGGPIDGCFQKPDAFALFDDQYLLSENRVRVYSREVFPGTHESSLEWNAILGIVRFNEENHYHEGTSNFIQEYFDLKESDLISSANKSFYNEWTKKFLFHCDESSPEEKVTLPSWM